MELRPRGDPRNAAERLASGNSLGCLLVTASTGVRFRVSDKTNSKSRGLFTLDALCKNQAVCVMRGKLVEGAAPPAGVEVFQAKKVAGGREATGCWLVLGPPTPEEPGALCNTASRGRGNNLRLCYKPGNNYVTLRATRSVRANEEMLVPYGATYTRRLRGSASPPPPPAPHALSFVLCELCGARVRAGMLSAHQAQLGCQRARRSAASKPPATHT